MNISARSSHQECLKRKVLQMIKKEISERNETIRKEREEVLAQWRAIKEEEVFGSANKKLSESKYGLREMLLEIKERFKKEP